MRWYIWDPMMVDLSGQVMSQNTPFLSGNPASVVVSLSIVYPPPNYNRQTFLVLFI